MRLRFTRPAEAALASTVDGVDRNPAAALRFRPGSRRHGSPGRYQTSATTSPRFPVALQEVRPGCTAFSIEPSARLIWIAGVWRSAQIPAETLVETGPPASALAG